MRHALRRLLSTPGFTLTAAITLAAAIGANALIFSVVNGVLLKPLPFAEPERLVGVWHVAPGIAPGPMNQAPSTYFTYREDGRVFQDIGLWDDTSVTVTGRGEPAQIDALMVTDGTLPLLGVRPALGRTFTREDDAPGPADTVMLSHEYWMRVFNGSPSAIGQTLMVNGRGREIVGVLPEGFTFLRYNPPGRAAVPLQSRRDLSRQLQLPGRRAAEAGSHHRAGQRGHRAADSDDARSVPLPPGFTREMFSAVRLGPLVRPLEVDVVGDIGPMLWVLLGTVGIVLLVACANVANLFLVRAEGRQQELAVRMALGAGTDRVARELLAESMLLGFVGAIGVGLAYAGIRLLVYLQPARLPRLSEITLDPIVLLFTLSLSLAAGLLFGVIPVLKYARPRLANALKENGRGSSDGRERHRARNTLVVSQVAMAVVLLVGIRSDGAHVPGDARGVARLRASRGSPDAARVDSAGRDRRCRTGGTNAPADRAADRSHRRRRSVGLSSSVTMDGVSSNDPIFVEDFPAARRADPALRRFKWIGERYSETMGNPIVAGRSITWKDVYGQRRS